MKFFMDIMMEGRNGIETGQELYSRNHSAKIIYITNFGQYCMDAVNTVHAFAFLEMPVSAEALEEQLQAFLRQYRKEEVRLEFQIAMMKFTPVLSHLRQIMLLSFFNGYIIIEMEEKTKKNFVTAVLVQMRKRLGVYYEDKRRIAGMSRSYHGIYHRQQMEAADYAESPCASLAFQ